MKGSTELGRAERNVRIALGILAAPSITAELVAGLGKQQSLSWKATANVQVTKET